MYGEKFLASYIIFEIRVAYRSGFIKVYWKLKQDCVYYLNEQNKQ